MKNLKKSLKKVTKIFGILIKSSDLGGIRVEGIPLPQFKTKKTKW
jgi:hypothetical protein